MGQLRTLVWEALPFTLMATMEACTIGLTILAKTAMTNGMSPFLFVVYTNALASILLLPLSFIFHCGDRTEQPIFTFPLVLRVFFLGLTGITIGQNLAFLALSYSSPILVCAMGLLLPAFSFMLSVILRTTKVDWRSPRFQAKVIGTLISIVGAIIVELYKGPVIVTTAVSFSYILQSKKQLLVFSSTPQHWILGGILLVAASLSISVWNVIQLGTVKQYPQVEVMKALFGGLIRTRVHIWCMQTRGPFYVPMFKPFGILFATIFGVSFFANSLHCGSVIGSTITGIGYYSVMWGQMREGEVREEYSAETEKGMPLLQEEMQV